MMNSNVVDWLAAFAAGAALALVLTRLIGGKAFAGAGLRLRCRLGVAVLGGAAALGLGAGTGFLTDGAGAAGFAQAVPVIASAEAAQGTAYRSGLPVEGRVASFDGAVEWLNSPPLTAEGLRGKVVLVDFWTYSCINCIRTIPYLRAWAEKYKDRGLVIVGVHTPEFAFERNVGNIRKAIDNFHIGYPVAVDSNFKIWRAFRNSYWPALYFVDASGQIRHHQFGEGGYDQSEKVIQALLAEAKGQAPGADALKPATPDAPGAQAAPDLDHVRSGETYLGYRQQSNFASAERVKDDAGRDYTIEQPSLNAWGLSGNWTVGAEQATLNRAGGGIVYRFKARDLHLVLGSSADDRPVRFQVTVDGKRPGDSHGADTDAEGNGTVTQTRLYQLVRQAGQVKERTFEVRFADPGVQAFVFTFG
jgi:thiol-disulfide isomerase/thioredoxin